MTAPRPHSRASTFASQDSTASSRNAALLGAATAFGRPKPNTSNALYNGPNSALAAAATVGSGSSTPNPLPAQGRSPAPPGAPALPSRSSQSVKSNAQKPIPTLNATDAPNLGVPLPARGHPKSPSQQAAFLASERAPPLSPSTTGGTTLSRKSTAKKPAAPPKPRRLSSTYQNNDECAETDRAPDSSPIPPTTSLVSMFERKSSVAQSDSKRPEPIVIKPSNDLTLRSPKPVRTSGGISSVFQMELENTEPASNEAADNSTSRSPHSIGKDKADSSSDDYASASEDIESSSPKTVFRRKDSAAAASKASVASQETPRGRAALPPLPLRHTATEPISIEQPLARTATTPSDRLSPSSASIKSIPAQYNQIYPPKLTPKLTGDQLANAMVAGSLASSRQPSPRRAEAPPMPPPSRRQKHHTFSLSRTPSPAKGGMRQTLRKAESDSSDDDADNMLHPYGKHKKKRHVRRHPNKHHEGDRKRWREAVTERERKRYEGVWAANKGMCYSFTTLEQSYFNQAPDSQNTVETKKAVLDQVSNIIARDIWSRSRLPETVLETVWDLVDSDGVGRLTKEEFVVGMWLIDQRLKGRKLPGKVSDTVWASVRSLQGIKIKK